MESYLTFFLKAGIYIVIINIINHNKINFPVTIAVIAKEKY
ncbi:MAG: hypothetical protein JWR67_1162 [Mucilaginibacter sp.]|nr:hypothetical protein [Mucilaginibacter sp.]